jgi:hypothetical protein
MDIGGWIVEGGWWMRVRCIVFIDLLDLLKIKIIG